TGLLARRSSSARIPPRAGTAGSRRHRIRGPCDRGRIASGLADEIAAETFMVAWRRFEHIPPEPLPWLYGVARNVVLRHRAGLARQAATRDVLGRERSPAAEPRNAGDDALWEAWGRLREPDR